MWMMSMTATLLALSVTGRVLADTYRLRAEAGAIAHDHIRSCGPDIQQKLQAVIDRTPTLVLEGERISLRTKTALVAATRSVVLGGRAHGFWDVLPGRLFAASIVPSATGPATITLSIIHRTEQPETEPLADTCFETWIGTVAPD